METVNLDAIIDTTVKGYLPDVVCFETGCTPEQVRDPSLYVYDHHGDIFCRHDSALMPFFEDLVMGKALPSTLITRDVTSIDTLLAITLFLQRDLILMPGTQGFVSAVDRFHRYGRPFLAHLPEDLEAFIVFLQSHISSVNGKVTHGQRITEASGYIHDFLTRGELPSLRLPFETPLKIVTEGAAGFIAGVTEGDLQTSWRIAWSNGYLRGVIFGPQLEGAQTAWIGWKSTHVQFDTEKLLSHLNHVEEGMFPGRKWTQKPNFIENPPQGTVWQIDDLIKLLARC